MSKLVTKINSMVFFGTSDFAVPILEFLIRGGYTVKAVVTQADQLADRKKIASSPVKKAAAKLGLAIKQPAKVKAILSWLEEIQPDLLVVAAYGQILPEALLRLPKFGALNIHPSLLPKYRGPSPIQAAILNGDKQTGTTLMLMDEDLDHGPVLTQAAWPIKKDDSFETLSNKLAELSVELLEKNLPLYLAGKIKLEPQKHESATFTKIIKRADGLIDWQKPAIEIERQLRAFTPWPGIYTIWTRPGRPLRLKITALSVNEVMASEAKQSLKPGFVFVVNKKPAIACATNTYIIINQIQPAGGRVMSGEEFLRGYRDFVGVNLA